MHSMNSEKEDEAPVESSAETSDKTKDALEFFLQKARSFQRPRTTKISILTPYREKILFAYEHGIALTTLLKTLEGEGIKTSYDNLRAYILRQKKGKSRG